MIMSRSRDGLMSKGVLPMFADSVGSCDLPPPFFLAQVFESATSLLRRTRHASAALLDGTPKAFSSFRIGSGQGRIQLGQGSTHAFSPGTSTAPFRARRPRPDA